MHEAEAWIQTFAGLSQDELGELLVAGRVIVTSGPNKRQIAVAGDAQRGFVRALIKRMNAAGHKVPTRTDDKETDDARLVAAQRTQEQRDQAAEATKEKGSKSVHKAGDLEDMDEETATETVEDAGKGTGKIADAVGGAAKETTDGGAVAEKTNSAKVVSGKDQSKGGGSESRDWKLSEALHISAEDIHNYIVVADGTVKLSPLGESLRNRTIQFNGRSIELQTVELLNIRQAGRGADATTMFMLRLDAGVAGQVLQEYVVKGDKFTSLDGKVDGVKLLAAFQGALKFDGHDWLIANKAPFTVDPYTMSVDGVSSSDEEEIVVRVFFSEVRTSTGYARVTTAHEGPQLVHAGQHVELRVPNPNKHHHTS